MGNSNPDERDEHAKAQLTQMEFAAGIKNGAYRELYRNNLLSIFDQAVERLKTSGLNEEVGSLRYVLARLMNEEQDLSRLSNNVARIVSVSIRTVQIHNAITGQSTNELVNQMTDLLKEIGGNLKSVPTEGIQS